MLHSFVKGLGNVTNKKGNCARGEGGGWRATPSLSGVLSTKTILHVHLLQIKRKSRLSKEEVFVDGWMEGGKRRLSIQ